jgi:hypothetical protein
MLRDWHFCSYCAFFNDKWEPCYATLRSFEIIDTSGNAMALQAWLIYLQNTNLMFDNVFVYGPKTKGNNLYTMIFILTSSVLWSFRIINTFYKGLSGHTMFKWKHNQLDFESNLWYYVHIFTPKCKKNNLVKTFSIIFKP